MPMLTVRLSDEEMVRLRDIAAPGSVAKAVREWIEASHLLMHGGPLPVAQITVSEPLKSILDDRRDFAPPKNPDDQMALPGAPRTFKLAKAGMAKMLIEDTRAAFKAATEHLSDDEVDTAVNAMTAEHPWAIAHEGIKGIVAHEPVKPTYLAAPDDDCAACHHDRQSYHLGPCTAPKGRRPCACPEFIEDMGFA